MALSSQTKSQSRQSITLFDYTVPECTNKNVIAISSKLVHVKLQGVLNSRATPGES